MHHVFLGGVCSETTWREELKPLLTCSYFDPVVSEWTDEDKAKEIQERATCNYVLYVLTPRMSGIYSLAELIDDSNKRSKQTLFVILKEDINDEGKRIVFIPEFKSSLDAIAELAVSNGALQFDSLQSVANFLNNN